MIWLHPRLRHFGGLPSHLHAHPSVAGLVVEPRSALFGGAVGLVCDLPCSIGCDARSWAHEHAPAVDNASLGVLGGSGAGARVAAHVAGGPGESVGCCPGRASWCRWRTCSGARDLARASSRLGRGKLQGGQAKESVLRRRSRRCLQRVLEGDCGGRRAGRAGAVVTSSFRIGPLRAEICRVAGAPDDRHDRETCRQACRSSRRAPAPGPRYTCRGAGNCAAAARAVRLLAARFKPYGTPLLGRQGAPGCARCVAVVAERSCCGSVCAIPPLALLSTLARGDLRDRIDPIPYLNVARAAPVLDRCRGGTLLAILDAHFGTTSPAKATGPR